MYVYAHIHDYIQICLCLALSLSLSVSHSLRAWHTKCEMAISDMYSIYADGTQQQQISAEGMGL